MSKMLRDHAARLSELATEADLDLDADEAYAILEERRRVVAEHMGVSAESADRYVDEDNLVTLVEHASAWPVADLPFNADMPAGPFPNPDSLMLNQLLSDAFDALPAEARGPQTRQVILHAVVHAWMEGHIEGESFCRCVCPQVGDPMHAATAARHRKSGGGMWLSKQRDAGNHPDVPLLGARPLPARRRS